MTKFDSNCPGCKFIGLVALHGELFPKQRGKTKWTLQPGPNHNYDCQLAIEVGMARESEQEFEDRKRQEWVAAEQARIDQDKAAEQLLKAIFGEGNDNAVS